jgi:hypothetical protein
MKPTIKIRFTEPQIALLMRAHPDCNLDRLTELSLNSIRPEGLSIAGRDRASGPSLAALPSLK